MLGVDQMCFSVHALEFLLNDDKFADNPHATKAKEKGQI